MKLRRLLFIAPPILMTAGVFFYSLFGGSTVLVSATVTATRYQGNNWVCSGPWLWMVQPANNTAFKDYHIMSTCAKCDIVKGSQIVIGIPTNQGGFFSHGMPLRANVTLFRAEGNHYAQWDGC